MKDKHKGKSSTAAAVNAAARRKTNVVELSVENEGRVRAVLQVRARTVIPDLELLALHPRKNTP